jgi:DNA-binding PadR family transcriptional regulator
METNEYLPLQEPTFLILLSLAREAKHGYAILKDVEQLSGGKIRLGTGTLYGALSRLLDQGLIQRSANGGAPEEDGGNPGKPRKTYRLTNHGLQILQAETTRLDHLLSAARLRLGDTRA